MILKQGHAYRAMPHDGKVIRRIYRGGRCYYDSPYSPEATQALKAAFPQYWTAIRDYGYAHPQLVPFINEDPMLIVSLVEVGKTRWLVGDGKAYIAIDDVPINGDTYEDYFWKVKTILKYTGAGWTTQGIGGASVCTTGMGISLNKNWAWADGFTDVQGTNATEYFDKVLVQELDFTNRTFKVWDENDNEVYSVSSINVRNPTNTGYNILFGWRSYSKSNKYIHPAKDAYAILRAGGKHKHLIPYNNGTECGMLDIVSLTFHPNANTEGAFTIEITDKE